MNLNNERVFTPSNKLTSYTVRIGEVELVHDAIISMEFSYKNNDPRVLGKLVFNDLYDMNLLIDWNSIEITVIYIDLKSETTEKTYRVNNVKEYEHSNYKKAFELSLQDIFSYRFEHSFLSRGFSSSSISAFQEYIDELGLSDYPTDFGNVNHEKTFTVPKSVNNLDFFIEQFKMDGYYLFQNQDGIVVRSLSELTPSSLPENDDVFTNETDNQYYKNKIIAHRNYLNNRKKVIPKTRSLAFDVDIKDIVYTTNNDKSAFSINDNLEDIQDDLGYIDVYQQHLNFDEHDSKLRDSFMSQNGIEIVVNGFRKNTINQVYEISLRGNVSTSDGQFKGNEIVNGKYVSKRVNDKIVGDSFIQKVYLERADAQSRS